MTTLEQAQQERQSQDLVLVTFFDDRGAATKHEEAGTPAELADLICAADAPEKGQLPLLKLARFGDVRSGKGSLRHDANVLAISGIEADYDDEQMSFEEAVEILRGTGVRGLIYTSPSHTPEKPHWRVLCPVSREMPPDQRDKLMGRLNGLFGGIFSPESWTLSQAYYFGSVNGNPAHRVEVIEGRPINELDELDAIARGKPHTEARVSSDGEPRSGPVDEAALLAEIASGDSYHEPKVQLIGKWASSAVPKEDARARLLAAFDAVPSEKQDSRWEERRADADRCLDDIYNKEARKPLVLNPGAPLDTAREIVKWSFTVDDKRTLHHQGGSFYHHRGTHYVEGTHEELRSDVYAFLDKAKQRAEDGKLTPFNPTKRKMGDVLDALAAETQLPYGVRAPAWLDKEDHPDPAELIACENGLLHLPSGQLIPHSPAFFNLNALTFAYDPDAPAPEEWFEFLAQLWPDDPDAIDTLQEFFGLCLTGDTSLQKALLIVGPKRSGKGTIARVLTALLGSTSVCSPTLSSLQTNFGPAPLIGKRAAIISDARLGGRADQAVIAERLLSISGEDGITIDRKFREPWTGKLDVRFLVLTNELPRLADASGALAGRFVILTLTHSFFGKEDRGLTAKLVAELPGIMKWSIMGWRRLMARGFFVQPESSDDAQQNLEDLGSPISAFIHEMCVTGPGRTVGCNRLFDEWQNWCKDNGRDHSGNLQTFARDLRAALPALRGLRPGGAPGEKRPRHYDGIGLQADEESGPRRSAVLTIARGTGENDYEAEKREDSKEHSGQDRGPPRTTAPGGGDAANDAKPAAARPWTYNPRTAADHGEWMARVKRTRTAG